jgi:hypothetical protein
MNTTLREALAGRIEDASFPGLDVADLIGLGETRLRRRRLVAVLGSAAAAVVVVIAFALGAALNGPVKRSDGPPVDHPSPSPTETHAPPVRPLFYIDVPLGRKHRPGVIHYGDRAIESDNAFVHSDVTDDGFVFTTKDEVWFSDGGSPVQIGSRLCALRGLRNGGIRHFAHGAVITGATGSLVAWFTCADPESQTLVVYDTSSGREIARQPMPMCDLVAGCDLDLGPVVGEHVYLTRTQVNHSTDSTKRRLLSYDVTTGRLTTATSRSFSDDVRSNPRGMVIGDTWETATPDNPAFHARGTRLVAWSDDDDAPTTAFDTATHLAIRLRLPPGYSPNPPPGSRGFSVFEWLDDDTVALTPEHNLESADIITCRLSEGSCRLTVKAGPDGMVRFQPGQGLPG